MSIPKFDYPSLETERVNLRIVTFQDTEAVYKHFSDEEVTRFMDIEPCQNIIEAEEMIRFHLLDSGCRWGLFEKDTNKFMGTCGFHCLRRTSEAFIAEVGFDLSKEHWGKGFMYEAMKAVTEFGFFKMGLTMIDATVDPGNERSQKLLTKMGFMREREARDGLIYFYLKSGES
ncbi:GNAT family N-acetyltransferase [Brevibacillus fluminis]|uniref:GNAT family N-acetyltransferase n=1 Tax=Brevibacillus fluminis TaxID=511487 RepID=UPI003F8B5984